MTRRRLLASAPLVILCTLLIATTGAGAVATSTLPAQSSARRSTVSGLAAAIPTSGDVSTTIEKAVAYLDGHQNADGSFGASYPVAETSLALIAYGVRDGGDINSLSSPRQALVKKAITWLLGQQDQTSGNQTSGTWGTYYTYYTGLAVSALAFNKNADPGVPAAISAGRQALIGLVQGPTHRPPITCSTADGDSTSNFCGGFNYEFDAGRSDESNTGFGLTGLALSGGVPADIAALDIGWQRHIQELTSNPFATRNDGGGSYQPGINSGNFSSNANDTGSLLFGFGYDGAPAADPAVQAAVKFGQDVLDVYGLTKSARNMVYHTGTNEDGACDPTVSGCDWAAAGGEGGYHYSLWALSKGLGEYISPNLSDSGNWYAKIADLLVTQQGTDGSWPQDGRDDASVIAATGFSVFALGLAGTPPPPVTGFDAASFQAGGSCSAVHLTWTIPNSPNYGGLMIRRRPDTFPTGPNDGALITRANTPAASFDDVGLAANATYYYGAFPYDTTGQLVGQEATKSASTATCTGGGSYVALGDSFSAGEGAPSASGFLFPTDIPSGPKKDLCHRSSLAYSQLLVGRPGFPPASSSQFWACSGAIIADYYHRNANNNEDPQRSHLDKSVTLVSLTMGGNDVQFPYIVGICVFVVNCQLTLDLPVRLLIALTKDRLIKLYRDILADAPNAQVYVLGYPQLVATSPSLVCQAVGLQPGEAQWLADRAAQLDAAIQGAVGAQQSTRIHYVDTLHLFSGGEACSESGRTGGSYVNGLVLSRKDYVFSFHPTPTGQALLASALAHAVRGR